jgi:aspartate ammonia-lyase
MERDSLGALPVPARAYYGIQTLRAVRNFPISGRRLPPAFVRAYARIKRSAAAANIRLGRLDARRGRAILRAAGEVIDGRHDDQFVVDVFQAGAGTSQNMNLNEVLANRAIEILGGRRGDYRIVHPNDHVNMSQSTNDTFPAAMRLAILQALPGLTRAFDGCAAALRRLGAANRGVAKTARTHLQDAVPIRMDQEFGGWAAMMTRASRRLVEAARPLRALNLGATAAGTGINAHPRFGRLATRLLARDTGLRLRPADEPIEAAMSTADFAAFSGALRGAALDAGRLAGDLRLLASGPATGLGEIVLPAVQPGSSIMPGKVNPVLCEMLNMVCFQVIGHDAAVAHASGAGQLELNVMMPLIIHDILDSMALLEAGLLAFTAGGLRGLRVDAARCRAHFERSPSLATALAPLLGYERTAALVREAVRTGRSVIDLAREGRLAPRGVLAGLLDARLLTRPGVLDPSGRAFRRRRGGAPSARGRPG